MPTGFDQGRRLFRSERGSDWPVSQTQIARMSGITPHAKYLAAPRRRALPRHPGFQCRDIGASVLRRDRERHVDVPVIDRRKRRLFGINHAGGAGLKLIASSLRFRVGSRRHCTGEHDRRGKNRFHGHSRRVFDDGQGDQTLRAIRDKIKLPVPTFRSSCAASAPTFHELRKVIGTGRLRETEFSKI
jgi:hypothetical protein